MNMNLAVFKLINGAAHESGLLDKIMIMVSKYGPFVFVIVLAAIYLYGVYSKNKTFRYIAVDTFAVVVTSLFLGLLIGIFYYEPRPFVTNKVDLLTPHALDSSFPSDHSLGTMSIALGINNFFKIPGTILIILSFLVGISRVYVGVHYPMDVIGSYFIVFVVNSIYGHLLRNKIRGIYSKLEEYFLKVISVKKQEV